MPLSIGKDFAETGRDFRAHNGDLAFAVTAVPSMTPARFAAGILAFAALALLIFAAFASGHYPVGARDLLALLWGRLTGAGQPGLDPALETVVLELRAPRIAAAAFIGAGLAAAGAAYQSLFRNPLASPDILGVSAGAAVGAVLGILFSLSVFAVQSLAFAFGLAAVALVYAVTRAVRGHDPLLVLVLAGVVIGSLLGACVALMKYLADPHSQLPAITFWLLGSLASASPADLRSMLPLLVIGFIPLWLLRWRINVLSLDDDEAKALGVETARLRPAVIAAATLITSSAVAVAGVIGWVGLVIPHLARLMVGPDFSRLLPASALLGAAFLLATDTLARAITETELPLGALTAFIGTPLFLWQLATARRSWQ
jgi:iron complex transport system permease protein